MSEAPELRRSGEDEELARGLGAAGLEAAEIEAFLAYSEAIERELGPRSGAIRPGRFGRWGLVLAAAALLLVTGLGATVGLLLGERGALTRELAGLRAERSAALELTRTLSLESGRLEASLASARAEAAALERTRARLEDEQEDLRSEVHRLQRDEGLAQAELVRFLQEQLLELAAMGDSEAPRVAGRIREVTRSFAERGSPRGWSDPWRPVRTPLDLGLTLSEGLEDPTWLVAASTRVD